MNALLHVLLFISTLWNCLIRWIECKKKNAYFGNTCIRILFSSIIYHLFRLSNLKKKKKSVLIEKYRRSLSLNLRSDVMRLLRAYKQSGACTRHTRHFACFIFFVYLSTFSGEVTLFWSMNRISCSPWYNNTIETFRFHNPTIHIYFNCYFKYKIFVFTFNDT